MRSNLTANDMELGIETVIEGEIRERNYCTGCQDFLEIVGKLPDNDITIRDR